MKKIILLTSVVLLFCANTVKAESIPIKLLPAENISTAYDEIQVGDNVLFKVKSDVYHNKNLIFKKDARVVASVSFLEDNGWGCDNAEILLSNFKLKSTSGNVVTTKSEVILNGFELLKTKGNRIAQFFNYMGVPFRGKEIDIKYNKDFPVFTIWYEI